MASIQLEANSNEVPSGRDDDTVGSMTSEESCNTPGRLKSASSRESRCHSRLTSPRSPSPVAKKLPGHTEKNKLLKPSEVQALSRLFAKADLDGSGAIDFEECYVLLREMSYAGSKEEVDRIWAQLDTNGDGSIDFKEFKKAWPLWMAVQAQAQQAEEGDVSSPPPDGKPPAKAGKFKGSVKKAATGPKDTSKSASPTFDVLLEIVPFLHQFKLYDPRVPEILKKKSLGLNNLVHISCDKVRMAYLFNDLELDRDDRDRMAYAITQERNNRVLRAKRIALVVNLGTYQDVRMCNAPQVSTDCEIINSLLLEAGYMVKYSHSESAVGGQPTSANIQALLRTMAIRADCLEVTTYATVIYIAGSAAVDDNGNVYMLGSDASLDSPIDKGLEVRCLAQQFLEKTNVALFVDVNNKYEIRSDGLHHVPGGLGILLHGVDILGVFESNHGEMSRTLMRILKGEVGAEPNVTLTAIFQQMTNVLIVRTDPKKTLLPSIGSLSSGGLPKVRRDSSKSPSSRRNSSLSPSQNKRRLSAVEETLVELSNPSIIEITAETKAKNQKMHRFDISCALEDDGDSVRAFMSKCSVFCKGEMLRKESVTVTFTGRLILEVEQPPSVFASAHVQESMQRQLNMLIAGPGKQNTTYSMMQTPGQSNGTLIIINLPIPNLMDLVDAQNEEANANRGSTMKTTKSMKKLKSGNNINKMADGVSPVAGAGEPDIPKAPLYASWEKAISEINERVPRIFADGRLGGIKLPPEPTLKRCYEISIKATGEQYQGLDNALRNALIPGMLALTKFQAAYKKTTVPPGVMIVEEGSEMLAAFLRSHQLMRDAAMAETVGDTQQARRVAESRQGDGRRHPTVKYVALGSLDDVFASAQDGDILELASGKHECQGLAMSKRMTLRGLGPSPVMISSAAEKTPTLSIYGQGCRLENITIANHNMAHPTLLISGSNPVILNCEILAAGTGVRVSGGDPTFIDCTIQNCRTGTGIEFNSRAKGLLKKCTLTKNQGPAIHVTGIQTAPKVYDCHIYGGKGCGILVEKDAKGFFVGNRIYDNSCPGMMVDKKANPIVWKNCFLQGRGTGLTITGNAGGRYETNTFSGNYDTEVSISSGYSVICKRNIFTCVEQKVEGMPKLASTAITVENTLAYIDHNDIEGYRVGIMGRDANSQLGVTCNRVCVGHNQVDSQPMRLTDGGNITMRFNDFFHWAPPSHSGGSNRHLDLHDISVVSATEMGFVSVMCQLIKAGCDVNDFAKNDQVETQASREYTTLTTAVRSNNPVLTQHLLGFKADTDKLDRTGMAPLHVAVTRGHTELVTMLLEKEAKVDILSSESVTPTQLVVKSGNEDLLQLLLQYRANPNQREIHKDATLIHMLCLADVQRLDLIEILINYGAEVNLLMLGGVSPLYLAIQLEKKDIVKFLLSKGADVHQATTEGDGPMALAARMGAMDTMKVLLENGASVTSTFGELGVTPIYAAVDAGQYQSVEFLLRNKAEAKGTILNGQSILHAAVMSRCLKTTKLLLGAGADPNQLDHHGNPVLYYVGPKLRSGLYNTTQFAILDACRTPDMFDKLQSYIKQKGADVNGRWAGGWTPLMHAMLFCNRRSTVLLLENGARPFATADNGFSALIWAYWVNAESIMGLVSSMGLKPLKSDEDGIKLLEAACEKDPTGQVSQLLRWNAVGQMALARMPDKTGLTEWWLPSRGYGGNYMVALSNKMHGTVEQPRFVYHGGRPIQIQHRPRTPPEETLLSFLIQAGESKYWRAVGSGMENNPPMDLLLWEARFFIANKVATGDTFPVVHMLALFLWSYDCDIYRQVNEALQTHDINLMSRWRPFMHYLQDALDALPACTDEVYIATTQTFDPDAYEPQSQTFVQYPVFTSATADYLNARSLLNDQDGILFVIQSKRGKNISEYAFNKEQQEVVFKQGAHFKVEPLYLPSKVGDEARRYQTCRDRLARISKMPGKIPSAIVNMVEMP